MRRVGLTGGIGSGKSTVARMLVDGGAILIDADAISRQMTAIGGDAIEPVRSRFGPHAIASDGAMDRDVMRHLVFSHPEARHALESIIHPLVSAETRRQAESAARQGSRCILFDIPLLVESGRWRPQLDAVLVIDCSETTQITRVMAREAGRSNWTREGVEKVIAGQASRSARLAAADICIHNDHLPLPALAGLVKQVAGRFGL